MKDKRNLLKIASIIEVIYVLIMALYYILKVDSKEEIIANLFFLAIGFVVSIILYKESKKDVNVLKKNNMKILLCSLWLFFEPIVPGVLGFCFLYLIKDKKKEAKLPEIKECMVYGKEAPKEEANKELIISVKVIPNMEEIEAQYGKDISEEKVKEIIWEKIKEVNI